MATEGLELGGQLIGVAEVAGLFGVTRQRADQLTREKGWPDPVDRVAPVDRYTLGAIDFLFEMAGPTITKEQAVQAIEAGAQQLPPSSPRLWRVADVVRWAAEHGRELHNSDGSKS
jgi:hypothetical protein